MSYLFVRIIILFVLQIPFEFTVQLLCWVPRIQRWKWLRPCPGMIYILMLKRVFQLLFMSECFIFLWLFSLNWFYPYPHSHPSGRIGLYLNGRELLYVFFWGINIYRGFPAQVQFLHVDRKHIQVKSALSTLSEDK